MKANCWEHKECGREPGGHSARTFGVCPAARTEALDGSHGGVNGGRACWVIAGTVCGGEPRGRFAAGLGSCEQCDFYGTVRKEEYPNFEFACFLLKKLD